MITVPAGGNLQSALDQAPSGETIQLEAGATFVGNFVLPAKPAGAPIVLQSGILRTPNALPALRTAPRACRWRLRDLAFFADASTGDILQLGDPAITALADVPSDLEVDRCLIRAERTAKRGIQLNSAHTTIRGCRIEGVKIQGQESQAIAGWTGPGPFTIEDCAIEAGSIGVLFGGAKPSIANLIPSGITFRRNRVTRLLALRGGGYAVKNLLELKNAQDVLIAGNTFEHNWPDGQGGYAIVFTVRANSDTAPWSVIRRVRFEYNVVKHAAAAFNILGQDYPQTSDVMDDVAIRHNLFYDIDRTNWGGNGWFMGIDRWPRHLHVEQNTILQSGNILGVSGGPVPGFRFVNNIVLRPAAGAYGMFGTNVGEGNPCFATYFPAVAGYPDTVIAGNVLAGATPSVYSSRPDNAFPSIAALMADFVDPLAAEYRLVASSALAGKGADLDALEAAAEPPPEPTLEDLIRDIAQSCEAACADVGGEVSPQQAAREAVAHMRDVLIQAVGTT